MASREFTLVDVLFEVNCEHAFCDSTCILTPSLITGHPITMNSLSYAIKFWSKGDMKALFLRHEGHLGATGAVS